MGLLQKISWATRKWNFKFNFLEVYLHDGDDCWGFSLCEVIKDYRTYSLLAIEFKLPDAEKQTKVRLINWDIFYISTHLHNWYINIIDNISWGYKPNKIEKIGINIAKRLL
jgi:hypothetical protein